MGFGNMVPNRGWFAMPWEPSKPTQMFAFTILLGVASCQIFGDWKWCIRLWPGEIWCLCRERASLWKQNPVCSLLCTDPGSPGLGSNEAPISHTQGGGVCHEKIPLPEALCYETELRPSPKGVRWFLKLTIAYFAKASTPWNCVGAEAQVPFLCLRGQPRAERHRLAPGPQGNAFSGSLLPKNTRAY